MAAPALIGTPTTVANASSGTTTTITKPASLADGETLLAVVSSAWPSGGIAPPGDSVAWTELYEVSSTAGLTTAVYVKYVASAAGEPASYAFTHSSAKNVGYMTRVSGCDSSQVYDVLGASTNTANGADTPTGITTTVADTLIIAVWGSVDSTALTMSGVTEWADVASGGSGGASSKTTSGSGYVTQASPGSSPAISATSSANNDISMLFALRPPQTTATSMPPLPRLRRTSSGLIQR